MARIVHLGLGNFHRAHQAWYTARAGDWKISGVVMSNTSLWSELADHGNVYSLGIWDAGGFSVEDVNVYDDVLLATKDAPEVIARVADPQTHVVTLTITEKGYHLKGDGKRLDLNAPAIRNDLDAKVPQSAIGLLCAGLIVRRVSHAAPITVISCDNLSENGRKLCQIVTDYVSESAPEALAWLKDAVRFPNTMVDRITPRLSEPVEDEIRAGARGASRPVVGTEGFSEWILEDSFAGPRPDWDKAGAQFVPDVAPFEERKLRLLNASHTYLAYAGLLAGHSFVHEAIADPHLKAGVLRLWDEAGATVSDPAALMLNAYRADLLDRFSVPAMRHALAQIAVDGSLKLRERLLPIKVRRAELGLPSEMVDQALQQWAAFVEGQIRNDVVLDDPNADVLAAIVRSDDAQAQRRLINWLFDGAETGAE